jgi:hypothetical protein
MSMSDTATPPSSPASSSSGERRPTAAAVDLSREIEAAVERTPHDRVKCAHVYGPYYRCNWWAADAVPEGTKREPIAPWALIATQRIRKSRFLSATLTEGKLQIDEVASAANG